MQQHSARPLSSLKKEPPTSIAIEIVVQTSSPQRHMRRATVTAFRLDTTCGALSIVFPPPALPLAVVTVLARSVMVE